MQNTIVIMPRGTTHIDIAKTNTSILNIIRLEGL